MKEIGRRKKTYVLSQFQTWDFLLTNHESHTFKLRRLGNEIAVILCPYDGYHDITMSCPMSLCIGAD